MTMNIESNDNLNNQEDYLDTDNDKRQDAGNADAAKFNTDEQEDAVNDREDTQHTNDQHLNNNTGNTEPPLTTQGDSAEMEENMGGSTNLSLDQLKKEGDPEGMDGK
ncbi:hypothetical protein [Mucilaginibacter sp. CSA2-8R]|uniref:hypothetical protein n=1 Tax=Mucilaginibacter sp. CSA2-8R TaxID=3141542 RepID=UPI00315CA9CB